MRKAKNTLSSFQLNIIYDSLNLKRNQRDSKKKKKKKVLGWNLFLKEPEKFKLYIIYENAS